MRRLTAVRKEILDCEELIEDEEDENRRMRLKRYWLCLHRHQRWLMIFYEENTGKKPKYNWDKLL